MYSDAQKINLSFNNAKLDLVRTYNYLEESLNNNLTIDIIDTLLFIMPDLFSKLIETVEISN